MTYVGGRPKGSAYDALHLLMNGFLDHAPNQLDLHDPETLKLVHKNSLIVLFRLLFILYAEDRDLFPIHNPVYAGHSLERLHTMINDRLHSGAIYDSREPGLWSELTALFDLIDYGLEDSVGNTVIPKYIGGLFNSGMYPEIAHTRNRWSIGDDALSHAIDMLSYVRERSDSPGSKSIGYDCLDVQHLGSIYEGLLGLQPQVADGAVYLVTNRGERKGTGSYYTPKYIVDYIVQNTVGPLADEAAHKVAVLRLESDKRLSEPNTQIEDERRSLLEPYLSLSILDPAMGSGHFLIGAADFLSHAMATDPNLLSPDDIGDEDLQAYFRRLVVQRCLYGVDLNPLAVELSKMCLWLHTVSKDGALSSLNDHLICGNSLVGFDWELEFPEQYFDSSGSKPDDERGFDAIIGNPPYLFGENIPSDIRSVSGSFRFATGQYDVYWLFYEKALTTLLKRSGYHGYVVPDAILARDEVGSLRAELTEKHCLRCLVYAGRVFQDPNVSAAVVVWQKKGLNDAPVMTGLTEEGRVHDRIGCNQREFTVLPGYRWLIHLKPQSLNLLSRVFAQSSGLAGVSRGEELGKRELTTDLQPDSVPVLVGEDISPLAYPIPSRYAKPDKLRKHSAKYASPKLVFVKTGQRIVATIDRDNLVTLQSVYNIHPGGPATRIGYVAALLYSRLLNWVAGKTFTDYHQMFPQFNQTTVKSLPIRRIDYHGPSVYLAIHLDQFKSAYLANSSSRDLYEFASAMLSGTPEQLDVVHDILAFLAEQMIELNRRKQNEVIHFLGGLESYLNCQVNNLSNKTRIIAYHAHSFESLLTILNRNRQKLGVSLHSSSSVFPVKSQFESSTAKLVLIKQRIAETESLIDQIVYKLYGLTEEEIRIVEGESNSDDALVSATSVIS